MMLSKVVWKVEYEAMQKSLSGKIAEMLFWDTQLAEIEFKLTHYLVSK